MVGSTVNFQNRLLIKPIAIIMKANKVTNLLLETFPSEETQLTKKFFIVFTFIINIHVS